MAGEPQEQDTSIAFIVGTLPDGRVLIDFQRMLDHVKLGQDTALDLAETLVEAVRQARQGAILRVPGAP